MTNYQLQKEDLIKSLNSSDNGLSDKQVKVNLEKYGKNEIVEGKQKSIIKIFLEQFADFLVIILICAAAVSAILKDVESTVVILIVITINAILGTVQTVKATNSLNSLKQLSSPNAKVIRNGSTVIVPSNQVTVGDVVLLEAGDYICADGRIIENASLKINESALTGESVSVEKVDCALNGELALADRINMLYSGSFVTYGRGKMLVTDTGMNTEVGKIAALIKNAGDRKTPLQINLDNFGKKLAIGIIIICIIVFGINIINGVDVMESLLFAVALAVAAIPEALSSIVTIVLSFGTQKMTKENAIMRKLQAVEGLGSVSIICSDKTGTLTQNKMVVQKIYADLSVIDKEHTDFNNPKHKGLILSSILCNDSINSDGKEIGDPTETALINYAALFGFNIERVREKYLRIAEIPFDSDRKLMSTMHKVHGVNTIITKGAVDVLIDRVNITQQEKNQIIQTAESMSAQGLRVLAFGYKATDKNEISTDDENNLTFSGLIAMMDPPRVESMDAVAQCKSAGIKAVMITGDHKVTAAAIAKKIGILDNENEAAEGSVIDGMSDEKLQEFVSKVSVWARVTPEHKIRIVRAWQQRGNIVAMTGDGVNDAPALKQADVGVAMGITGTEVSKDAADMVLTDDNFATIVKSVKNGRNLYANIKRAILFLLSGNLAGIITVLFASIFSLPVPFAAVQLLFINLLTDSLPAIALGLEPHTSDVMKEKPRPVNESILNKSFISWVSIDGIIISIATIAAFMIGYYFTPGSDAVREAVCMSMAFITLCFCRLLHGFTCKSQQSVLFSKRFFNNKYLLGAFVLGTLLLASVIFISPLAAAFKVAALSTNMILVILGLSLATLIVGEIVKLIYNKIIRR